MTSKEWVKEQLSYTDDHWTTTDRIMLTKILKALEHLEELEKENKELSQANSLLTKTLKIVIDCITNATELNPLKIDIMNKILKEVLDE